jgi:glucose 1-dehydrogenase
MARKWAAGLASHRIRVNIVEPGWIDTPGERTFYSEEQIREEGRKLPVNAANSIRMCGGWILQIQTWPISAMRRRKFESTPR